MKKTKKKQLKYPRYFIYVGMGVAPTFVRYFILKSQCEGIIRLFNGKTLSGDFYELGYGRCLPPAGGISSQFWKEVPSEAELVLNI